MKHKEMNNAMEVTKNESRQDFIQPFSVCIDIELGPLLPEITKPHDSIAESWIQVKKNKDSSDPSKTKGDPRRYGADRINSNSRVEAVSKMLIDKNQ